jgi:hypothetical protein
LREADPVEPAAKALVLFLDNDRSKGRFNARFCNVFSGSPALRVIAAQMVRLFMKHLFHAAKLPL